MGAVKNFFSGVEGDGHFNAAAAAGATHVLTSFLYIRKRKIWDYVRLRKKKHPHIKFMIDSGAHTIITDKAKFKDWTMKDWDNYLTEYVTWVRENKKHIFACVELDIDYVVGTAVVERWQKQYFIPLLQEGVQVIFCWHTERGTEGWEDMCSRFPYVGLPGEMSSQPDFNVYMAIAKRYTTKVHGFAATKQSDFRDFPWHSVDSITWKTGEMYGITFDWDEAKQRLFMLQADKEERPAVRERLRHKMEAAGFNATAIIEETDYKEVTRWSLYCMSQMEKFYERIYEKRTQYWEKRLPHPNKVKRLKDKSIYRWWNLLNAEKPFKQHLENVSMQSMRDYVVAMACVQYSDLSYASKEGRAFLTAYFSVFMSMAQVDWRAFQKELSIKIAPRNPRALRRTEPEHFIPGPTAPRVRDELIKDFYNEDEQYPFTLEELLTPDDLAQLRLESNSRLYLTQT